MLTYTLEYRINRGENSRGVWEWFDIITIIGELEQSAGWVFGEIENSRLHLLMNSGSVECTF